MKTVCRVLEAIIFLLLVASVFHLLHPVKVSSGKLIVFVVVFKFLCEDFLRSCIEGFFKECGL